MEPRCRPPARLHGRIPASGARRRAEEGSLWGLTPETREGSVTTLMIGSTVASPQAGPLLHVLPILFRPPHAYAFEWEKVKEKKHLLEK